MLKLTELSRPNVKSIMKNIKAQKVLPGIVANELMINRIKSTMNEIF